MMGGGGGTSATDPLMTWLAILYVTMHGRNFICNSRSGFFGFFF